MKLLKTGFVIAAITGMAISAANAQTLRWARSGDSLTLDPHAQNEGPTHALAHQIYEPLLQQHGWPDHTGSCHILESSV